MQTFSYMALHCIESNLCYIAVKDATNTIVGYAPCSYDKFLTYSDRTHVHGDINKTHVYKDVNIILNKFFN